MMGSSTAWTKGRPMAMRVMSLAAVLASKMVHPITGHLAWITNAAREAVAGSIVDSYGDTLWLGLKGTANDIVAISPFQTLHPKARDLFQTEMFWMRGSPAAAALQNAYSPGGGGKVDRANQECVRLRPVRFALSRARKLPIGPRDVAWAGQELVGQLLYPEIPPPVRGGWRKSAG